jgi:undecaprenyl-diphosphatase
MIFESINRSLFLSWNADPSAAAWKLKIAEAMANDLIFVVPLILVAMWCWGGKEQRDTALKICAVALIALGVNQLLGTAFPHPRPFAIGLGHTFIPHANDSSFPSDHATVFASMGVTLLFASARSALGWTVLILGSWVAWARIYLGVHYPLDMIGALAVVAAVCALIGPVWLLFGPRVVEGVEKLYRLVLSAPIQRGWIRR